ncbi:MAG: ABC transporter permease [Treponema sp.]|jgi:simple sugar transport system permease protein|nr:ABC transporter permease [Treponema sp.]
MMSLWFLGNTLDCFALLLAASLGAALSFRGGAFNLGGEGQIYLGGLAAALTLQALPGPGPLALTAAALAALAIGALLGGLCGLLHKTLAADPLITTFLLSAALSPLADALIGGPLRDPRGSLLALPPLAAGRVLPRLLPPSRLSVSLPAALLLAGAFHAFVKRTVPGYRYRVAGAAPDFARYGGIDPLMTRAWALAASGALFGLAGFFAAAGTYGRCHIGFPGGLGWNAIACALIARSAVPALIPICLAYASLEAGIDAAALAGGLGFDTRAFIRAAALFLAAMLFIKEGGRLPCRGSAEHRPLVRPPWGRTALLRKDSLRPTPQAEPS